MLNHTNTKYTGTPSIPVAVGDRHYAQDLFRDFRFHQYFNGLLYERLFGSDTCIIEGFEISQGTGHTIDITAGKGIIPYSVRIPHRTNAWAIPPDTEDIDINALVMIESNLTNQAITSAVTDGATVNYVKLAYTEDDENTRTRAKKAGTYSYEISPSYVLSVDDTAPTAYELTLETFTSDGATLTFLGNEDDRIDLGLYNVNFHKELDADYTLKVNRRYEISEPGIELTIPSSANIGDTIEIFSEQGSKILHSTSNNLINYINKYYTTKGTDGYLQLLCKNNVKLTYKGNGLFPDIDPPTKLSDPGTLPAGTGRGCAFSYDNVYLAVAHDSSPYITIYKRSGDTFTKLSNPATLPTGNANGCAISYDGTYFAVAHDSSPYITIYKRSGDTFTKLSDPATLPTGQGYGCTFSYDSNYLAVSHFSSPYITIYKRSGDTFTKLSNPTTLPTGHGYGCAFSYDSNYLAVVHTTSPYVTIYGRSGDAFTKLSDPGTLPASDGYGCAFSYDGNYLSVAHITSPYIRIYSYDGGTFTALGSPATLPTGNGLGCAFSYNGHLRSNYLAVTHVTSPYVTIYRLTLDYTTIKTKLSDPATLPTGNAQNCVFSYDGNYLVVVHTTSPYVTIYKCVDTATNTWIVVDINNMHEQDLEYMFK